LANAPSVVMLSVVILGVVMMRVVAPSIQQKNILAENIFIAKTMNHKTFFVGKNWLNGFVIVSYFYPSLIFSSKAKTTPGADVINIFTAVSKEFS
jgi:hypothetical protein